MGSQQRRGQTAPPETSSDAGRIALRRRTHVFWSIVLIAVNVAFVPAAHWWKTFVGFFKFSGLPHPIDWSLIGAFAATAGSGKSCVIGRNSCSSEGIATPRRRST